MTAAARARLIASVVALACLSGAIAPVDATGKAFGLDSAKTDKPATIWAVGDGNAYTDGQRVERLIEAGKPKRFLYLGDVYETGTALEFAQNYHPSYGRLANLTAPTPGNHEWPLHADGYDVYWRGLLGKRIPQYYRFTIGGWEIFSLNSESAHDESSAQIAWLRRKLSARRAKGTCRLAFWHRPRYSEGQLLADDPGVEPFWRLLRGRAKLVINAHDHNMQRFTPIGGITELIVGSGGHGLHPLNPSRPRVAFANDTDYGALRLRLQRGRASYRFLAVDGRTLDAGSIRCKLPRSKKKRP